MLLNQKKNPGLSANLGPGKYVFDKVKTSFVLALMCGECGGIFFSHLRREHCKVKAISKLYPRSITNASACTQIDKTFLDRHT